MTCTNCNTTIQAGYEKVINLTFDQPVIVCSDCKQRLQPKFAGSFFDVNSISNKALTLELAGIAADVDLNSLL